MKHNLIKLGQIIEDNATGLKGTLTLVLINQDNKIQYAIQPRGLDSLRHQPLDPFWVTEARIKGNVEREVIEVPTEVLGTEVEDMPTGFKGTAINIIRHLSGCNHIEIQPRGSTKTGGIILPENFDYTRVKGPAIKKMKPAEVKEKRETTPSPGGMPAREVFARR